jgi:hypothetical protein
MSWGRYICLKDRKGQSTGSEQQVAKGPRCTHETWGRAGTPGPRLTGKADTAHAHTTRHAALAAPCLAFRSAPIARSHRRLYHRPAPGRGRAVHRQVPSGRAWRTPSRTPAAPPGCSPPRPKAPHQHQRRYVRADPRRRRHRGHRAYQQRHHHASWPGRRGPWPSQGRPPEEIHLFPVSRHPEHPGLRTMRWQAPKTGSTRDCPQLG